jgi:hypothetical protein
MKSTFLLLTFTGLTLISCRTEGCVDPVAINYDEKAEKDDGTCKYAEVEEEYSVPTTYLFEDANGNSTVSFSGQSERLNQLREMVALMSSANTNVISNSNLKDMFANTNGDGNGNFSFNSTKQLKDKCFSIDVNLFENWMDSIARSSTFNQDTAVVNKAGLIYSGTDAYLVNRNGYEYKQLIEKGLMGAVFMNQALNIYFSSDKMVVDNTMAVDPTNGKYYTTMEHHFDEAFGYFGVPTDFPTTLASDFWGKYCNSQNNGLESNEVMMDNFLKGRAAISNHAYTDRDEAINEIRLMWENVSAYQAITYLNQAIGHFGTDNAKYLHTLSEAYAFIWNLRYASETTRRLTPNEHNTLMAMFKPSLWSMTVQDLNAIKSTLIGKY